MVPLMLYGLLPATLLFFRWLKPQRAALLSCLIAFLFLPQTMVTLPIIPNYDRATGTIYSIGLGILLFDIDRLKRLKLGWIDIPVFVWCLCPLASSISNDLGVYNGVLATLGEIMKWGGPYLVGRLYFSSLEGLKQLAIGIFVGGLIYVPLCLYEIRMSPILHLQVYGFFGGPFGQAIRYGGYRPMVFLKHGLQVGLWMMAASLVGIWLWKSKTIQHVLGIPIKWLVGLQCAVFILVKSTGAVILLAFGALILFVSNWTRMSIIVWFIVLAIPLYLYSSASGDLQTDQVVEFIADINPERAQSFAFRLDQEHVLAEMARERPILGWGGWDRFSIYGGWHNEKISVTDSLWIIAYGNRGAVGLSSLFLFLLMPVLVLLTTYPPATWSDKRVAPVAALSILILMYTLDSVLNQMYIPIFIIVSGGITGLAMSRVPKVEGHGISVAERYLSPGK
ncbi:MAG: O-antigen ligase family protein [Leptolyngbyaceae cyanobacterium]